MRVATLVGFLAVVAVLLVSALVIVDKPHFGWLVGPAFLPAVTITIVAGGILMFIGVRKSVPRGGWRRPLLLIWAVIAAVSPAFGLMFMLPWSVLALALPFVIAAQWRRGNV